MFLASDGNSRGFHAAVGEEDLPELDDLCGRRGEGRGGGAGLQSGDADADRQTGGGRSRLLGLGQINGDLRVWRHSTLPPGFGAV